MHIRTTYRKFLAILLVVPVIHTSIYASEKVWDSIPFKEPSILDEATNKYQSMMIEKYLQRQQSKQSKGVSTKTTSDTPKPNSSSNATSYIESNYAGLFKIGGTPVSPHVIANDKHTIKYGEKFGVDPAIMRALMSQECYSGQDTTGAAWGPAQIEDTLDEDFKSFGIKYFGKPLNITEDVATDDRLNAEYSIAFACYRFSQDLEYYKGDYVKALQAYNFSKYSLNPLIKAFPNGNDWVKNRKNIAYYNGHFRKTGSTKYGDPKYVENVLKFYNP